ncbi:Uncharacterised protein [Burkholderia pseudomallei]|nr:Uncharacterised protein [Burkholderia pseudomallei]CAJ3122808.1 Uncharacterised protein [Burkholderia pseudomallei]CAJ3157261.1 Uncharacterised protein [Burkholderia pseudomallei]CAJ3210330.1 Uncharacterised protein [Burkholderia pseudomallei]CAJ3891722.1 Uncharacterised protein [Burkholderia pseudomallei]
MSAGVPAQRRKRAGVRPQARLAVGRGRPAGASPGSAGWRRGRSVRWARMATVSRTDEAIGAIVRVNIATHAREESVRAPYLAATSVRGREPHKVISSRAPSPARDGFKPGSSRVRAGFERGSSGVQAQARGERRDGARRHARSAGVRRAPTRLHSGGVSESRPRTPAGRGGGVRALAGTVRVTPGPCSAVPRVFAGARDGDGRAMGASAHRLRGRGSGRRAVPAAAWCGRSWRRRISVDAEDRRGAPGSSSVIGNRACICICRSDMAPLQSRGGACRSARVSMSRSTAGSVTSTSAGGAAASSARAPVSPSSAASAS